MGDGYVAKPEDVVKVGETIEVRIIELSRRRGRVDLSLKGLREEPDGPAPSAAYDQSSHSHPAVDAKDRAGSEQGDHFEDVEVLSPMELAFKRAMEAEGSSNAEHARSEANADGSDRNRSLQDEIIARPTLDEGRLTSAQSFGRGV